MPQLNPAPWFAILIFSWAVFLMILPPKVTAHELPNEPTLLSAKTPKTKTWTWSWH
uniref:ATP synthase F0 subunit 8 n=1 Tax=Prionotus carolinus TaxID=1266880 RepID=UPI0028D20255|nr:ATP synthase F0 subunit 8 [Prionotus carolinus]WMY90166.1 ATP synthase F0 subunit 8 [Prionotus carolinus]